MLRRGARSSRGLLLPLVVSWALFAALSCSAADRNESRPPTVKARDQVATEPIDRPIIFIPTSYREYAPQGAARSWLWSLDTVPAIAPALLETLRTHAVRELKLDPELYRVKQNGERRSMSG